MIFSELECLLKGLNHSGDIKESPTFSGSLEVLMVSLVTFEITAHLGTNVVFSTSAEV